MHWGSIIAALKLRMRILAISVTAAALLAMSLAGGSSCAPAGYVEHVSAAIRALETGQTRDSLESLELAMERNANDPLAYVVLGLTMLMGGRADEANAHFAAAREMDGNCAEAIYGQALVLLAKGQLGPATSLFCEAQGANPDVDMQGAIRYAKWLGGSADSQGSDTAGEATRSMQALALMKRGQHAEAAAIWRELRESGFRAGYGERIGCSMTFVPGAPVVFTGWPLNDSHTPVPADTGRLPVASGKLTLRADLSKASGVSMVAFFVDNVFVGMTNTPPFQYVWDTTRTANGPHTIRITGTDTGGSTISEKTMQVMVRNAGSTVSRRVSGEAAEDAWRKLREVMELRPSVCAVNYNIALCAQAAGDREGQIGALERVLAADPAYLDAGQWMVKLLRPEGKYEKLHGISTARKVIALTFDDGPKPDSHSLLEALALKGVKATFFVVGKQVEAHPEIVKRMADDGHEIQNHTHSHRALEFLNTREIEQELFRGSAAVNSVTGRSPTMLRPPGARFGEKPAEVMKRYGIKTVFWTANCSKFEGTTREKMLDYVVSSAKPGGIVLMHNLDRVTLAALPAVIDALRSKGYSFVTLSELLNVRDG